MKNRKGFTLVEILVTIAILGILTSVAVFSVSNLTKNARAEKDTQNVNTLKMAAESYAQANKEYLPKLVGESTRIEISELNNNNFIKENITDQNDKSCMSESYVDVTKISKNEYIYEPHLICEGKEITSPTENEKPKTNPEIIITINGKKSGKEVKSGDLVNANYSISFKGDTKDGSIGIISYSYSISVNNVEVYNSGNQLGNNNPTISINDINISKYLDLTKDNEVSIKGVLINKEGDRATKTNKITVTEDNSVIISDDTPPVCPSLENNPDGREGEPAENTDWLNKKDIKDGLKRQISLTCNDGNGSGCKRQKFSKTWPNNSDKEGKTIIKDTITLTDNTGKESECEVNVNIDAVSPKLSVLEDKNIKKTITVEANNNYNETDPKATIESNNEYYNNLYNNKWLNASAITKDGISYSIEASDDIGIKKIKWETKNNTKEGSTSDENINLDIAGEKIYAFNVSFIHDGEREGTITVEDVAGNTAKIVIKANLDRTPPTTPTVSMYKWNNNNSEPNSSNGLQIYNQKEWSNKNIYSEVISTDSVSGIDDNSYQSTLTKYSQATNKNGKNLNITDEGQMLVKYKVCDNAANCIETDSYNVWIDKTNPTCTNEVTSLSPKNSNGWITKEGSTVTITAKCKDELSGCKEENPASMIYNEQINIKNAGASGIGKKTTVEDNAGNKATCPANQEIKMDWEPPKGLTVNVYKWKSNDVLPKSDNDIIKDTSLKRLNEKNDENQLKFSFNFSNTSGLKYITCEDKKCECISPKEKECDWIDSKVYTRAEGAKDNISGIDYYEYTTDGATTQEKNIKRSYRNIEADGESVIKYVVCDKAGNCSDPVISGVKISKYAPSITCKLDEYGNITDINIKTTGDKYYFNDCSEVTSDSSKCITKNNYETMVTSMATTAAGIQATWGNVSMPTTCGSRTYYGYVKAQSVSTGKETIAKCSGSYSTESCDDCNVEHPEKCPWVTSCRAGDTTLYFDDIYTWAGTAYHSLNGRNDRIYVLPKEGKDNSITIGRVTWRRVYIPSYDYYYPGYNFVYIAENCLGPYYKVCPYSQCPG